MIRSDRTEQTTSELLMIRMTKLIFNSHPTGESRVLFFQTAFMLASAITIGMLTSSIQAQSGSRPIRNRPPRSQFLEERSVEPKDESRSEISLAREKARDAKKKFETVKKT